jgi:carboxyl-terminal processing protease
MEPGNLFANAESVILCGMHRLVFWLFAVTAFSPLLRGEDTSNANPDSPYDKVQVLTRAMQLIRQDYVDEKKVSYHDLTYSALKGMLADLDPHSEFMDPNDFKGMQEETKSEFGGLGIVVTLEDGALVIVNPMEDTPGFDAGIMPGDKILRINNEATDKLTLSQAVDLLRGDVGEKISLTLQRPSTKEIKEYNLTRVSIKMKSVKDAQVLTNTPDGKRIGYVRITKFTEPAASELVKALDGLEKQGIDALVLDLRNNPGGLLGSAVDVCGLFLPPGTRVVYTEGRSPTREYKTSSLAGKPRTYPLAILVNYASASGSEIVAGALRDLNRAVLVGETTFGKGSVQSVMALPDGSALRLTTAKYFTPGGQVIHGHGVSPTIKATLTSEQEYELWKTRRDDAGKGRPLSLDKDLQLARAVDLLQGELIFAERQQKEKTAVKGS